jgi:hypothetical protein
MIAMTERARLVEEMIELIHPDTGCEARCREEIGERIIGIEKTHEKREVYFPVAEVKAQMNQLHGVLEKVELLVSKLNFLARASLFTDGPPQRRLHGPRSNDPELDREIDRQLDQFRGVNAAEFGRELAFLIETTGGLANNVKPPKAAPRRSQARVMASDAAFRLIGDFAPFPPTRTKRGRFFRLASMLFEAATGEHKADLTRDCRETLSDYSQVAKAHSTFGPPTLKAEAERLTRLTSRRRRPTKHTDG